MDTAVNGCVRIFRLHGTVASLKIRTGAATPEVLSLS
jgi:hypothetical protein